MNTLRIYALIFCFILGFNHLVLRSRLPRPSLWT